jgi:hypothetical protein
MQYSDIDNDFLSNLGLDDFVNANLSTNRSLKPVSSGVHLELVGAPPLDLISGACYHFYGDEHDVVLKSISSLTNKSRVCHLTFSLDPVSTGVQSIYISSTDAAKALIKSTNEHFDVFVFDSIPMIISDKEKLDSLCDATAKGIMQSLNTLSELARELKVTLVFLNHERDGRIYMLEKVRAFTTSDIKII